MGRAGVSLRLAEVVAAVDAAKYDAIILGYTLCSNGVVGLSAGSESPVPRHDCITLFLGGEERYLNYFRAAIPACTRRPAG